MQQSIHWSGSATQSQQPAQTPLLQIFDWRILILLGTGLAVAFNLISAGFSALQKRKNNFLQVVQAT
ncbi:MAG: hypothetical protein HZB50_13495 [Chloroflexi bacterium]|nr:hypothetical protein [Chloroflexota bacterium]